MIVRLCRCSILLSTLLALPAGAGDWPQFLGPERSGICAETGLISAFPDGGPQQLDNEVPRSAGQESRNGLPD